MSSNSTLASKIPYLWMPLISFLTNDLYNWRKYMPQGQGLRLRSKEKGLKRRRTFRRNSLRKKGRESKRRLFRNEPLFRVPTSKTKMAFCLIYNLTSTRALKRLPLIWRKGWTFPPWRGPYPLIVQACPKAGKNGLSNGVCLTVSSISWNLLYFFQWYVSLWLFFSISKMANTLLQCSK